MENATPPRATTTTADIKGFAPLLRLVANLNPLYLLLIGAMAVGSFCAVVWLGSLSLGFGAKTATEQQTVLLEKVKKVCKLVTVEGQFADIYSYEDHTYYDISIFKKKALLKVVAKVSVGYDLGKATFRTDPATHTLTISNLPKPEIIAIDPDVSYYDITEGSFNTFSEAELTQLNQKAKTHIRDIAEHSSLMQTAASQGNQIFDLIDTLCHDAGWNVVYSPPRIINIKD